MVRLAWALSAFAVASASVAGVRAACECGYLDPATNELWTDAVITYFNETNAADQIVFQPEQYADRYGRDRPGYAGDGQQAWINSDRINEWEDDFSATWRSAVVPNNTYLDASHSGLRMDVTPADTKRRISWGSQLQTRRRDILYGSFRTMLLPPVGRYKQGTDFDVEVAWNQSELIRMAFFSTDVPGQGNVQVSYASNTVEPAPVLWNQSTLNVGGYTGTDPLEYRMDWLPKSVSFTNTGTNASSNAHVWAGEKMHTPSKGSPFSYKHWSNGSPNQSQGPPVHGAVSADIVYARLFFNSSLSQRTQEFNQACATAAASTCSTDDHTLRNSTVFDMAATQKQVHKGKKRHVPVYSIYGAAISGGIFFILTVHAVIRRTRSTRQKRAAFYAKYNTEHADDQGEPSSPSHHSARTPSDRLTAEWDDDTVNELDKRTFGQAMAKWEHPDMLLDSERMEHIGDSDDESDEDEDEKAAEAWHYAGETSSIHSGVSNGSGYVLPHIQLSHADLTRSGLATPRTISGTSTPISPSGLRPIALTATPSLPSIRGLHPGTITSHQTGSGSVSPSGLNTPNLGASVLSFNDDGYGNPPAMPHVAPTVLLEDGSSAPVTWVTPIADWAPAQTDQSKAHGQLAAAPAQVAAQDQKDTAEFEPPSYWHRFKANFFVGTGEGVWTTSSGTARVEYLDGLRGFACFLVSFHHFCLIYYYGFTTQPTGSGEHYKFEYWIFKILGPIMCNGGLNVGIFFVLSARVVCNRFLHRGNLQHLAQLIQTRVPRLGVTITAAILINYFLIEVQAFYWTSKLASRTFSVWSFYQDFEHVGVFIDEWLGLWWLQAPSVTPFITHYATGILWTVPVIVQCTWTCVLCALIAREVKIPSRRYPFYAVCIVLSWWANRFDYFFLAGLMLADLDVRYGYRQKLGQAGHALALAFFFLGAVLTWLNYANVIHTANEWAIHPDFMTGTPNKWVGSQQAWYLPNATDGVFVMSFFLLCDLSPPVRKFFQMRFWSVFGRNAFSLYLIHGIVFWSIGAAACLKMLAAGVPYWAAILLNILLCYSVLFVACELFTRTFDHWGITLSRSLWRAVSGGIGRRAS